MIATLEPWAYTWPFRPRWTLFVVGIAVTAALTGCGGPLASEEPNLRLVATNEGSRPAVFDLIEFDFETNEAGRSLGWNIVPLEPGATMRGDLTLPSTGSWALTINGIMAIPSFEFAERDRTSPGSGLLPYHITVYDEALEVSVGDRGADPDAGTTTPPDATRLGSGFPRG